jgi:hypothetical protein
MFGSVHSLLQNQAGKPRLSFRYRISKSANARPREQAPSPNRILAIASDDRTCCIDTRSGKLRVHGGSLSPMRRSSAARRLWIASPMLTGLLVAAPYKRKSEMVVVFGFLYKPDMNFQSVRKGGQFSHVFAGAFDLKRRPVEGCGKSHD